MRVGGGGGHNIFVAVLIQKLDDGVHKVSILSK